METERGGEGGEARVLVILVAGLPGCGKSSLCSAILEAARDAPGLFGVPAPEWHYLCYDAVENDCRTEAGAEAGAFDVEAWRLARARVAERAVDLASAGASVGSGRQVLLVDDNFYYRGMRRWWYRLAVAHRACFRQVFLRVGTEVCVARNGARSAAARVPDFSIRHMAEVFEWPSGTARASAPWEELPGVTALLDAGDGQPTSSQVEQLLSVLTQAGTASLWLPAVSLERETREASEQGTTHVLDLALRKVVTRALAEAPKELAKARPELAKAWGVRKAQLVSQLPALLAARVDGQSNDSEGDGCFVADACQELEEVFLRGCMLDIRRRLDGISAAASAA